MTTAAVIWYLVVGTYNGGGVLIPNPYDTYEACHEAGVEAVRNATGDGYPNHSPAGWNFVCVRAS